MWRSLCLYFDYSSNSVQNLQLFNSAMSTIIDFSCKTYVKQEILDDKNQKAAFSYLMHS